VRGLTPEETAAGFEMFKRISPNGEKPKTTPFEVSKDYKIGDKP
jgi:hypothetical protein